METNKSLYTIKGVRSTNTECDSKILGHVEPCDVKKYMQDLFSSELANIYKVTDSTILARLTPDSISIKYSEIGVNKKISVYVNDDFNVIFENESIYPTINSERLNVTTADEIETVITKLAEMKVEKLRARGVSNIAVEVSEDNRSIFIKYTDEANDDIDIMYTVTEVK